MRHSILFDLCAVMARAYSVHFSMKTTLNSFSKVQHVVRSTVPVLLQPESSIPLRRMYENAHRGNLMRIK